MENLKMDKADARKIAKEILMSLSIEKKKSSRRTYIRLFKKSS